MQKEWFISDLNLYVESKYYYSPTGSSSDAWRGYMVWESKDGNFLFNIETNETDINKVRELIITELKNRYSSAKNKQIKFTALAKKYAKLLGFVEETINMIKYTIHEIIIVLVVLGILIITGLFLTRYNVQAEVVALNWNRVIYVEHQRLVREVYAPYYTYNIMRWIKARELFSNGSHLVEPYWEEANLLKDERIGRISEQYKIIFHTIEKKPREFCVLKSQKEWASFLLKEHVTLVINGMGTLLEIKRSEG